MGLMQGMTSNLYRYTHDGRRIYRLRTIYPLRAWTNYEITDDVRERFEKNWKRLMIVGIFVVVPILANVLVSSPDDDLRFWLGILAGGVAAGTLSAALQRFWILSGIVRVELDEKDLVPVDRRERDLANARATGRTTLMFMCGYSVLMVLMMLGILVDGDYLLGIVGIGLFGTMSVMTFRQIMLLDGRGGGGPGDHSLR